MPKAALRLLDVLFYAVHLAVVLFITLGWIPPVTRMAHLVFISLTLGSWYILGIWKGRGYCPLTDWHWMVKASGEGKRPEGPFIHTLAEKISGRKLKVTTVNGSVEALTWALAALSLYLNFRHP